LPNLDVIYLSYNPLLTGTFTARCGMKVLISGTSIDLCGCAASTSPVVKLNTAGTFACSSTGPATPLTKRGLVFSTNIGDYRFKCTNDTNGNPFQDCINAQGALCKPTYIAGNNTRISDCRNAVNTMNRGLSSFWQNVRKSCGQWSFDGIIGSVTSSNCVNANNALKTNAFYILPDGSKQYVDDPFIDSVNTGLWGNTVLKA